jgi:outer membrane lipoprotein LolB
VSAGAAPTWPDDLATRQANPVGSPMRPRSAWAGACNRLIVLGASLSLSACGSLSKPQSQTLGFEPAATPVPAPSAVPGASAPQARQGEAQAPCEGLEPSDPSWATDASSQAANAPAVAIQGQLSLKLGAMGDQPARGLSLGFFFNGREQAGELELMTLMGSQLAQVSWTADQVWLVDDQGRRSFDSLEALSQQILGEALPLRALVPWMQGQPARFLPCQRGPLPGQFVQDGWQIDTRDQASHRLQAQRPASASQRAVLIKFYLDR